MSHRIIQVSELIKKELGYLMITNIEYPKNTICTITDVTISKDLRHAKVWLSVLPTQYSQKILAILNKKAGILQSLLNKKLSLKPLPRIRFVVDEGQSEAFDMERLLDRIKKEV